MKTWKISIFIFICLCLCIVSCKNNDDSQGTKTVTARYEVTTSDSINFESRIAFLNGTNSTLKVDTVVKGSWSLELKNLELGTLLYVSAIPLPLIETADISKVSLTSRLFINGKLYEEDKGNPNSAVTLVLDSTFF